MGSILKDFVFEPIVPIPIMGAVCVVLIIFKRRGVIPYIRQILCVALLFLINLRPMLPADNIVIQRQRTDLNVIFIVDDTISMLGNDQAGYDTRLDRAKADMGYIIENLPGARFSVVTFNNNNHILTPLTDSIDYLNNAIDSIYPIAPTYATGTNLSTCISALESSLGLAETGSGDTDSVVFILSDGENTDGNVQQGFGKLGGEISGGAVMGYGTASGGQMEYYDELIDDHRWIMEPGTGEPGVTRIDEENLEFVADELGLPYINMSDDGVLEPIVTELRDHYESEPEEETEQGYEDVYYYLVIPLALLTAYELISLRRRG